MSRIAYINGRYVPKSHAQVAVEDRGYLFSDGVYDVLPVHGGKLAFAERYLDRLDRSLAELKIARPMSRAALLHVMNGVPTFSGNAHGSSPRARRRASQADRRAARPEGSSPANSATPGLKWS